MDNEQSENLEQEQPENLEEESQEEAQPNPEEVGKDLASAALEELDESRLPSQKTVCMECPNSVWFASASELKCFCRVMHVVIWTNKEQNALIACDGQYLSLIHI